MLFPMSGRSSSFSPSPGRRAAAMRSFVAFHAVSGFSVSVDAIGVCILSFEQGSHTIEDVRDFLIGGMIGVHGLRNDSQSSRQDFEMELLCLPCHIAVRLHQQGSFQNHGDSLGRSIETCAIAYSKSGSASKEKGRPSSQSRTRTCNRPSSKQAPGITFSP